MKTATCPLCSRTVEVRDGRLIRHGAYFQAQQRCGGEGLRVVTDPQAKKRPPVGKIARAPCGHWGEHVTTNIVTCPDCDKVAAPEAVEREITQPWAAIDWDLGGEGEG